MLIAFHLVCDPLIILNMVLHCSFQKMYWFDTNRLVPYPFAVFVIPRVLPSSAYSRVKVNSRA